MQTQNSTDKQTHFNIDPKVDYSTWYRRVLYDADIIDNRYPLKGMYAWRGRGLYMRKKLFQICEEKWRNMGVEDVEMPTLVPIDLLQKMEEHSLGVENHCYQIKQSGLSTITNALILPPSTHPSLQTLLSNIIHEHTLPYGIMTTTKIFRVGESRSLVPLIRSREMWWNEVHMSYVSPKQAESSMNVVWENLNDIFDTFCVTGIRLRRPKWSTYPGAEYTECFDSILPNGRVLQIAAVHNLGTKFAQAYKIKYQTSTSQEYVYQTCHAVSTRLLALTISTHGDHHGLILPPFLVPIQVIILPILKKNVDEEPIKKAVLDLKNELQQWFRCDVDLSSKRPGDKFYKYELQGVPIRIEIGPSEVENKVVRIVRRDTGEKETVLVNELHAKIEEIMRSMTINLKERAINKWNVSEATTLEQVSEIITNQGGLVRVHVYDPHLDLTSTQTDEEKLEYGNSLENKVYEATNGGEIRGYSPTDEYTKHGKCIFTDRDANTFMYIAKQ